MIGVVPHFTPPAYSQPPYWPCCAVIGAPGETVCWACEQPSTPKHPPVLHTSTGSVVVGETELAD